jgi:hypothetical protein
MLVVGFSADYCQPAEFQSPEVDQLVVGKV